MRPVSRSSSSRGGKLIGREYFVLEGTEDTTDNEVMTEFVKQFYTEAANIPQQVMRRRKSRKRRSSANGCARGAVEGRWKFPSPRSGQRHELVKMAAENATETLQALRSQWQADTHKQEQALAELQSAFSCYRRRRTGWSATIFPIPREWPP